MMSPFSQLPATETLVRAGIAKAVIDHPAFLSGVSKIRKLISDAVSGLPPTVTVLTGPSRCGKTEIIKAVASEYPSVTLNGIRQIPVLVVYVRSSMGPKDLPSAVISAMGLPVPKTGRVGELSLYMVRKLILANVKVIIFDEASHVVDQGARIQAYAASDWFKDLHCGFHSSESPEKTGFSIILTGVPRLRRILETNPQLRNRANKPLTLLPYRWNVEDDRTAFAGCVRAFLTFLTNAGHSVDIPTNALVRNCYVASAGHIGLLAKFFEHLVTALTSGQSVSYQTCQAACGDMNLPGDGVIVPFADHNASDSDLMRVLTTELDRYDLVLPRVAALV